MHVRRRLSLASLRRLLLKGPFALLRLRWAASRRSRQAQQVQLPRLPMQLLRWQTCHCSPPCRRFLWVVWRPSDVWPFCLAIQRAPWLIQRRVVLLWWGKDGHLVCQRQHDCSEMCVLCPKYFWGVLMVFMQWVMVSRCWGRWPAFKLVLSGMKTGDRDAPQVLVKMNGKPTPCPSIDALIMVSNAEIRDAWRSSQGIIPESLVVPQLASRELSVTFPAPKRRRDALQSLGVRQGWGMHMPSKCRGKLVSKVGISWCACNGVGYCVDCSSEVVHPDFGRASSRRQFPNGILWRFGAWPCAGGAEWHLRCLLLQGSWSWAGFWGGREDPQTGPCGRHRGRIDRQILGLVCCMSWFLSCHAWVTPDGVLDGNWLDMQGQKCLEPICGSRGFIAVLLPRLDGGALWLPCRKRSIATGPSPGARWGAGVFEPTHTAGVCQFVLPDGVPSRWRRMSNKPIWL